MAEKQRLFVDMDGTLAVFQRVDRLEALYEYGYFANLPPIENVIQAVKLIIKNHPEIDVHILSAYLTDSPYALIEKQQWLDQYLPEIDAAHRIFTPCGQDKKEFIPGGIRGSDFLLDDYTHNLCLWQPPARGIKLLNGINHTNGTWMYDCIRYDKSPAELAENIVGVMQGRLRIRDVKPQLDGQAMCSGPAFHILQLKDGEQNRYRRFISLQELINQGEIPNLSNYSLVFSGVMKPGWDLNNIYHEFNFNRPSTFQSRSLSVSDIIVVESPNEISAYYVDSIGFQAVPLVAEQFMIQNSSCLSSLNTEEELEL